MKVQICEHWVEKVTWEGEWRFCLRAVCERVYHSCDKVERYSNWKQFTAFIDLFVCVCVCTCTYRRSEVNLGCPSDTIIDLVFLFSKIESLTTSSQGLPHLCLPNAGITSVKCAALHSGVSEWLFHTIDHWGKHHTYLPLLVVTKDCTDKSVLCTASREQTPQNTSPQQPF